MKVIDNFLEQDKFNFFKKEVTSSYFTILTIKKY